jgi:hypothetical protein
VWQRWREWWSTAHSSVIAHRVLKWLWVFPGIPVALWLRESVPFLVGISVYAVIVGHWSGEEGAMAAEQAEQQLMERLDEIAAAVGAESASTDT